MSRACGYFHILLINSDNLGQSNRADLVEHVNLDH